MRGPKQRRGEVIERGETRRRGRGSVILRGQGERAALVGSLQLLACQSVLASCEGGHITEYLATAHHIVCSYCTHRAAGTDRYTS